MSEVDKVEADVKAKEDEVQADASVKIAEVKTYVADVKADEKKFLDRVKEAPLALQLFAVVGFVTVLLVATHIVFILG